MTVLDELRESGSVARLAEYLLPNGHPEQGGSVWRAGGASGDQGRSLTCTIDGPNAGTYFDHATEESGSLIQLLREHERLDTVGEARDWLIQNGYISRAIAERGKTPKEQFGGQIDEAAPDNAQAPKNRAKDKDGGFVSPSAQWRYETADGRTAFYVSRYDFPDGSKSVLPRSWGTRQSSTGKTITGWQGKSYPVPRPLYHLPELIERGDDPIVVVEGEKAADAAKRLIPGAVATTSAGGSKAAKQTNWVPAATAHRNVYLIPDADDAGESYIAHVASLLRAETPGVKVYRVDPKRLASQFGVTNIGSGWDIADVPDLRNPIDLGVLQSIAEPYEPPKELVPRRSSKRIDAADRNHAIEMAVQQLRSDQLTYVGGEFWKLTGQHWEPVLGDAIFRRVDRALKTIGAEMKPDEGKWLNSNDHREAMHELRAVSTPESVELIDAELEMRPFHLDTGDIADGTAFTNGVLWIDSDGKPRLRPHEPRIFRRWSLPYAWEEERAFPSRFITHLLECYQDSENLSLLTAELIGYTLSGDRSAQVIPLLQGASRAGKGVILDILIELLGGSDRVSTPDGPAQLASRFGLGDAANKAAIIIGDMPATPPLKAAQNPFLEGMNKIKGISGESPVKIESKNKDLVDIRLPVVVWLANNWKIGWVHGAEDVTAWAERLIILPFDKTVPREQRIKNLYLKIIEEDGLAQIANYCLHAYLDAVRRGDGDRVAWTEDERSAAVLTEIVKGAAGQASEFVSRRIAFLPDAWTPRTQLTEEYAAFIQRKPSQKEMGLVYTTLRNYVSVREGKRRGYEGFHGIAIGEAAGAEAHEFDGFTDN